MRKGKGQWTYELCGGGDSYGWEEWTLNAIAGRGVGRLYRYINGKTFWATQDDNRTKKPRYKKFKTLNAAIKYVEGKIEE